jgi:hypothetical protein
VSYFLRRWLNGRPCFRLCRFIQLCNMSIVSVLNYVVCHGWNLMLLLDVMYVWTSMVKLSMVYSLPRYTLFLCSVWVSLSIRHSQNPIDPSALLHFWKANCCLVWLLNWLMSPLVWNQGNESLLKTRLLWIATTKETGPS